MLNAAAIANPASPAGMATRRSRSGCVITSPRPRSGVPDTRLKTNGTRVSGTNRSSRSRRIHDQLLATVVRVTLLSPFGEGRAESPSPSGGGSGWELVRMIDDVLDRFALSQDRPDQVLDHRLVIGMVGVGDQPFLVAEIGHQGEVGVPVLDAEVAAEAVRLDARNFCGELMQRGLDLGDVFGGGFRFTAEKGDVAQHRRLGASGDT